MLYFDVTGEKCRADGVQSIIAESGRLDAARDCRG
jgi:hypothetical protein